MRVRYLVLFGGLLTAAVAASAALHVPVPPFKSVKLIGGGTIILRYAPVPRVGLVSGNLRYTSLRVRSDGTLAVKACNRRCPRGYRPVVEIHSPTVPGLAASRGGRIAAAPGFAAQRLIVIAVQGGAQVDTRAVAAAEVSAAVSGGGQAHVWPVRTLHAAVNGGGLVGYRGNPVVKTAIHGGGVVSQTR